MAERQRRGATLPDPRPSRQIILDAAERLFADHGFAAVAISDVCKASGFPVGSVYHHFRNKAGLLSAVLRRGSDRFFESLLAISASVESPEQRTRIFYERAAELAAEHSRILRLQCLLQMQVPSDPEVHAALRSLTELVTQRLTAIIEPLVVEAGVERHHDLAAELAAFTLAHTAGLIVTTGGREAELRAGMRQLYRFIEFSVREGCVLPGAAR